MLKLGIPLLFFTLCLAFTSSIHAQTHIDGLGHIQINIDSLLKGQDFDIDRGFADSLSRSWKNFVPAPNPSSKHYYSREDKRYYIDIVPPAIKGKEIDHSGVWLLGGK